MKTKYLKKGKVSITGMTYEQYAMIRECVVRCQDVMLWADELQCAEDGDCFIWLIDNKRDFDVLQSLKL